jgi:predicted phosphodiesterase
MRLLVFSDVHGSLSALEALMNTGDFKNSDKVIFLGDVVMGCSRPNECIKLLHDKQCICLLGNNDSYICDHIPLVDLGEFDDVKCEQIDYMRNIVSDENKMIMKSWKKDLYLNIKNRKFYFTHYLWERYNDDFNVVDTPNDRSGNAYFEMFKEIKADYVIFGHEHVPGVFCKGKKNFYCVGTLGLKNPGCYLVMDIGENGIVVEERKISFDIENEIKLMDKAGYPYGKDKINI